MNSMHFLNTAADSICLSTVTSTENMLLHKYFGCTLIQGKTTEHQHQLVEVNQARLLKYNDTWDMNADPALWLLTDKH